MGQCSGSDSADAQSSGTLATVTPPDGLCKHNSDIPFPNISVPVKELTQDYELDIAPSVVSQPKLHAPDKVLS